MLRFSGPRGEPTPVRSELAGSRELESHTRKGATPLRTGAGAPARLTAQKRCRCSARNSRVRAGLRSEDHTSRRSPRYLVPASHRSRTFKLHTSSCSWRAAAATIRTPLGAIRLPTGAVRPHGSPPSIWCAERDLNPHVLRRPALNRLRLPFRHLRAFELVRAEGFEPSKPRGLNAQGVPGSQ